MGVKQLLDLSGRTALVTGGSRGLGLQIAEALGELGARVALVARKGDELDAAVAHLATQNIEAVPLVCDLSDAPAIPPMVARADRTVGPMDIPNVGRFAIFLDPLGAALGIIKLQPPSA